MSRAQNSELHVHKDLGAALGSFEFVGQYIAEKVAEWVRQIELLSEIALSQPHAAYAASSHTSQEARS